MAASIDASLNVMGYDRVIDIRINNIHISKITGGQSQAVLLFLIDDERIKTFPPEMQTAMQPLFCLKEGENTIEISFKEKGQPSMPSPLTITIDAANYEMPVLKYAKNPEIKDGHAKGAFSIYPTAPAGFATVVLE